MKLKGKIAVVTGGASGFGKAICQAFEHEGAHVVVSDIDAIKATIVAEQIGDNAVSTYCNVANKNDVENLIKTTVKQFGGIDIMVNNAGYTHTKAPLYEVSEEQFDRVYSVNVKSIYLSSMFVVPEMIKRGGGVIINTASTAAVRPRPELTWYNSSKGAVVTMTKSMAGELAKHKIRVCALNPVIGETGMLENFMGMEDTPENRIQFLAGIPLGRFSRPEDIAKAALYLASDDASMVTGVALEIDGGRCI